MTGEQLRQAIRPHPFIPFTITMGDGRRFRVAHPEFIALTHTGRIAYVVNADDSYSILDLLLMTELQLAPGGPNGEGV